MLVVKVHRDEGLASHIGPEPCLVVREGGYEASVGVQVRGYFAYHAVSMNIHVLQSVRHNVLKLWRRTPRRQCQQVCMTWERMEGIEND